MIDRVYAVQIEEPEGYHTYQIFSTRAPAEQLAAALRRETAIVEEFVLDQDFSDEWITEIQVGRDGMIRRAETLIDHHRLAGGLRFSYDGIDVEHTYLQFQMPGREIPKALDRAQVLHSQLIDEDFLWPEGRDDFFDRQTALQDWYEDHRYLVHGSPAF